MTVDLKEYVDLQIKNVQNMADERDRRYTDVNAEREKATKLKEEADRTALILASSDLKTAIGRLEVAIKPLIDYVSTQQGSNSGSDRSRSVLIQNILLAATLIGVLWSIFGR